MTRSRRYKEELEHANPGLEDAYAELQSTNEELETMNEEMQATNEELQTINDELGRRTTELNQRNAVQATNRRGRAVTCRVTCTPLLDRDKTLRGVIVVVADDPGQQAPVAPVL